MVKLAEWSYRLLDRFILTRRHIAELRHMLEIIRPSDEQTILLETMKLCGKEFAAAFLVFISGFLVMGINEREFWKGPPGSWTHPFLILAVIVYLVSRQVLWSNISRKELRLLRQMEKYLGDVRHYYHSSGMVEEAIFDSLEQADREISLHMEKIYHILIDSEEGASDQYAETAPNKYLITFLALCKITIRYGDSLYENTSLFLSNLNHLKNEVNVEILRRERLNHVFSGLLFITILPAFFLKAVEKWSVASLPELQSYYSGSFGIFVVVLILLSTLFSYFLIHWLRNSHTVYRKSHGMLERIAAFPYINRLIADWIYKNAGGARRLDMLLKRTAEGITLPQYLVRKGMIAVFFAAAALLLLFQTVSAARWNAIHDTLDYKGNGSVSDPQKLTQDKRIIEELGNKYRNRPPNTGTVQIIDRQLENQYGFTDPNERKALVDEIDKRINSYQGIWFRWYYLLPAFAVGILASFTPRLMMECRGYFIRTGMEEEVMQFQSIIIMLMHIRQMSVPVILEWLENFSEIFRSAIMECADRYAYDDELAFLGLKEQEPFMPFVRIVENLEACDRVGVEKAFDEIKGQRNYLLEKRKLDNEINISNKSVIGRVAAYIPLILTVGLYLIVPFVLESLNQLTGYMEQLQVK